MLLRVSQLLFLRLVYTDLLQCSEMADAQSWSLLLLQLEVCSIFHHVLPGSPSCVKFQSSNHLAFNVCITFGHCHEESLVFSGHWGFSGIFVGLCLTVFEFWDTSWSHASMSDHFLVILLELHLDTASMVQYFKMFSRHLRLDSGDLRSPAFHLTYHLHILLIPYIILYDSLGHSANILSSRARYS